MTNDSTESFEEFKDSFSYGPRNDLSFKFLKRLSAEQAGEFFRQMLFEIGDQFDVASSDRLVDLVYDWQVKAYEPGESVKRPYVYDDHPFTPLTKPLDSTTIGLVTSSGHYVNGCDPSPFGMTDMTQEQAIERVDDFLRSVPELTTIPRDTPDSSLRVRHPGYDVRSASRDPGVAFPRSALIDAEQDGRIGRLADELYSFVGACAQGRIRNEAPRWVERWKQAGIEALFLVPV
jgi:hypothetical protein